MRFQNLLHRLRHDPHGVTAIEYALIAALIAIVIIAALNGLGKGVGNTFGRVSSEL